MTEIDIRRGATSASNAPADALCAGRHLAQKGLPDIQTEDADFGTQIHTALAKSDDSGLSPEQQSIFEGCKQIELEMVKQFFGPDWEKAKAIREQRFWCKIKSGDGANEYEHSGQVDVCYRLGTKALIIEYKTLPGDRPGVATNGQLRDQAVLVRGGLLVSEVGVGLSQPLVSYDPTICMYDEAALAQAEKEMFARVLASNSPDSPRTPGKPQCDFCKAKLQCAEYQKWAAVTVPGTSSLVDTPVVEWTPAQRATFCEQLPLATKWLESCKAEMKRLLKADPEAIPGWTLEDGNTRSWVVDPNALHQRFLESGGKTEAFMAAVAITKEKLTLAVREATKLKGKALERKVADLLAGLTESKQNDSSLAKK
jgi:hypothetical protein